MSTPSDNVWIGDLPVGMDKGTLATLFEAYGTVVESRMLPGKDETAKPCAMVRFAGVDVAQWVVENLNGNIPEGLTEPVVCRFANSPYGKGKGKDDGKGGARFDPYAGGAAKGKGGGKAGFEPPAPSDNVWIGDLPIGTEKNNLAEIFEAYGQIVDSRILPGRDPAAMPCAMIRFASVDMATWVVENLNGNIPQGLETAIICRFANGKGGGGQKGESKGGWAPQQAATGGWQQPGVAAAWGGGGKGKGGGKGGGKAGSFEALFQSAKGTGVLGGGTAPAECQCFVKNLPADTTDCDLYKLFAPFGAIPPNGVKAMMNPDGTCKGIGFVDFSEPAAAQTAVMALDGHSCPDGSTIGVSQKQASAGGKGKGKKGKEDQSGSQKGGW